VLIFASPVARTAQNLLEEFIICVQAHLSGAFMRKY